MNFYREFFKLTFEICFAIFIIIFGYAIWDTFDQTPYKTAKYYENNTEFDLYIEDEENKLYLHNISSKESIAKVLFKTNKTEKIDENVNIIISDRIYKINDLECIEDEYFCYYVVNTIELNGYETKEFNCIINNDDIDFEIVATI